MNNWLQYNKKSAIVGGVGIILFFVIAGLGVSYYLSESEAHDNIWKAEDTISSMSRRPLPPTRKVLDESTELVKKYEADVKGIEASYDQFRAASSMPHIDAQSFQNALKAESGEWLKTCKEKNITVNNEAKWMGFDLYQASAPSANAANMLNFQKAGIENFINTLMECGITRFYHIYRPQLPVEKAKVADADSPPARFANVEEEASWQYMPFEVSFLGDRQSVAKALNAIAKSDKYLYVFSAMRVKNEKEKADVFAVVKPEDKAKTNTALQGGVTLAIPGVADAAPAPKDEDEPKPVISEEILKQVLGDEKVKVHLAVNLVRFPVKTEETEAPEQAGDEDGEE